MSKRRKEKQRGRTSLGCAVALGTSAIAFAQNQQDPNNTNLSKVAATERSLDEIVVTATRRATSVVDVPYNITAIGGQELANQGIDSISKLAQDVPGLDFTDTGAKYSRSVGQLLIIRGLNGTGSNEMPIAAQGQAPVATYFGDTPLFAYYPVHDIDHIEVLRGPQGTLFGAGTLSGALRIIPNAPQLHSTSAQINVSGAEVAHAANGDYSESGVLNLALGDRSAFRISAGHDQNGGYIDGLGLFKLANSSSSAPVVQTGNLASPAVLAPQNGINYEQSTYGRIAVRVEPGDLWKFTLAYDWVQSKGGDANADNPAFHGGPYASDAPPPPGITLPASGNYEQVQSTLQPWETTTQISSLDLEVDFGFATLASNSSYFTSKVASDVAVSLDGEPYAVYYQGSPRFPAWTGRDQFPSDEYGISQEMRLVSANSDRTEWVAGAYYSNQRVDTAWIINDIGMKAWRAFSGSPYPDGFLYNEVTTLLEPYSRNTELAGFGEFTYHISHAWQATAGGRLFRTESDSTQDFESTTVPGFHYALMSSNSNSYTGHLFKLNTTYEYIDRQRLYATWSQGFRRGGANPLPTSGVLPELPSLLTFQPDFVTNWEVGAKGQLDLGITYTAAAFYEKLKDIQIETSTPVDGYPLIVNGRDATSKGIELEFEGKLTKQLRGTLAYAYADATLQDSFAVATAYGSIYGNAGDRLPGSAKNSLGGTLTYDIPLSATTGLSLTGSPNYKGSVVFALPNSTLPVPERAGGYMLYNANAALACGPWTITLFGDNLANKRAVLSQNFGQTTPDNRTMEYFVNQPRAVGLRLKYKF